jgi:hypothetical protein
MTRCACHELPTRLGIELGRQASMTIARRCETHGAGMAPLGSVQLERFDALQDLLSELAVLEGGPLLFGVPTRWFESRALRFRCPNGHVSESDDPQTIVVGNCPACVAPVALTFPEDVDDPPTCEARRDGYHFGRDRLRAVLLGVLGSRG